MAFDLEKNLTRAKRSLEKNRIDDAIEAYCEILEALPNHQESMQALGDLYTRKSDVENSARYYGMLFDRLVDNKDPVKAAAIFSRFLKSSTQPPERVIKFAALMQKQNRRDEAIEQYENAAELYLFQQRTADALTCWEKVCVLDPENAERHFLIGEVGERLNFTDTAVRGFLRAGQLKLGQNDVDSALQILARAYKIAPRDRGVAVTYGDALIRKGRAHEAVGLLAPLYSDSADTPMQLLYGDALLADGQRERAFAIFEAHCRRTRENFDRLFDVVVRQLEAGEETKAVESLNKIRTAMASAGLEKFAAACESVIEANANSVAILEFASRLYNEQNRETKYFNVLGRLFDIHMAAGNVKGACETLERLVDVDPYDLRHDERLAKLEGRADPANLRNIRGRLAKSAGVAGQTGRVARFERETPAPATHAAEQKGRQSLDDMIVQAEIFLQYSLEAKAKDRLQKIAEEFPGEEENNTRLRALYEQAKWWPSNSKLKPQPAGAATTTSGSVVRSGVYSADTLRDLTKISEITKALYRQPTPKAILSAAVNEAGKHLRSSRCLAAIGTPGQPPQMASEFCASGLEPSPGPVLVKLLAYLAELPPDPLGSWKLEAAAAPVIKEMGLETACAVQLIDKETQTPAGVLLAGMATPRTWKANENYFLQAVGDQALMAVNHSKLRSLMRTLAVADEKTGLLSPASYLDCLLAETARAKVQSTSLSVVILQVDKAREMARQYGEEQIEGYMEQLSRALLTGVRQTDIAVKYQGWSVAFIMPDTSGAMALPLAEKLRRLGASVKPPWNTSSITLSAAVAEAGIEGPIENEDIVTLLVNRAESALDEARKRGGDAVVSR
jgi:diguanylate cyclase (GGDEF)-like protein